MDSKVTASVIPHSTVMTFAFIFKSPSSPCCCCSCFCCCEILQSLIEVSWEQEATRVSLSFSLTNWTSLTQSEWPVRLKARQN